jgi:hypothetical protein
LRRINPAEAGLVRERSDLLPARIDDHRPKIFKALTEGALSAVVLCGVSAKFDPLFPMNKMKMHTASPVSKVSGFYPSLTVQEGYSKREQDGIQFAANF